MLFPHKMKLKDFNLAPSACSFLSERPAQVEKINSRVEIPKSCFINFHNTSDSWDFPEDEHTPPSETSDLFQNVYYLLMGKQKKWN